MTESRSFDLSDFDTINATTGVRAIVTTGADFAVRVEARDAATLDRIDVSAAGGRLHLGISRGFLDFVLSGGMVDMLRHGGDFGVVAYVTLPQLNGAEASSGGRIEATNVKSARFHADASSGGNLSLLAVSAEDIRATVSSGGVIEIEGTCGEIDVSASSGGLLRGDKLTGRRGRLEASSGGNLQVTVTQRVKAHASSGGNIRVMGNPSDRDVNSSSGGYVSVR